MNLVDLVPVSAIPHAGGPEDCEKRWFNTDTPDAYRRNSGHALYGETDIVYRFNEWGYRSGPLEHAATCIRLMSIGSGLTFGVGVPEEVTFHERFAARLRAALETPVVAWNLGIPGASNDALTRVLHLAVEVLQPHIVLIGFAPVQRREYVTAHGRHVMFDPDREPEEPAAKYLWKHFKALSNKYADQLNLFRAYKSMESLLAKRCWVFLLDDPSDSGSVALLRDSRHRAPTAEQLDFARDHIHPGPKTHGVLSESLWGTFLRFKWLDRGRPL